MKTSEEGAWAAAHALGEKVPTLRELKSAFLPLSKGRARLVRAHALLDQYEPSPQPYVYRNLARFVKTIDYLEPVVKGRWLDISSDPWFCLVAKAEMGAIDLTPSSLEGGDIVFRPKAGGPEQRLHSLTVNIGADGFTVGDTGFDVVSNFELIEHLQVHPAGFLASISKILKDGGTMVLSTPNVASWASVNRLMDGATPHMTPQYGGPLYHRKEYTIWEMQQLLEAANYEITMLDTFNAYPSDNFGALSETLRLGVIAYNAATLNAKRTRNLLLRGGSTMMVVATKKGPCDVEKVRAVEL